MVYNTLKKKTLTFTNPLLIGVKELSHFSYLIGSILLHETLASF